jgi:predicted DNA-binding ribbon-helix-helix protein
MMQRHNFFLEKELVEELKVIAKSKKISMAKLIRDILDTYLLERQCKKS